MPRPMKFSHMPRITSASQEIRWSAENGVAQIADLGRHVARRARFSDLVILPRPYGKDRNAESEPIVEAAMFEGHAPVLLVPDDVEPISSPKTVIGGLETKASKPCGPSAVPCHL